jgi:hypothetical protein
MADAAAKLNRPKRPGESLVYFVQFKRDQRTLWQAPGKCLGSSSLSRSETPLEWRSH